MILDVGTTTVSTAGTEQQISNTANRVLWLKAKALAANSGITYLGVSDVTATNGYELSAGNEIEINFADVGGSIAFSTVYVDAATTLVHCASLKDIVISGISSSPLISLSLLLIFELHLTTLQLVR